MNKRKLLLVALSLCMVAILAMGGTLAYLTDTDNATNTFTVGNVDIEQYEWERVKDENGEFTSDLTPYTEPEGGKKLFPIVFDGSNEEGYHIGKNYIDKIVTVKNTGSEDAYIRTHIAIPVVLDDENKAVDNILHWNGASASDTNRPAYYNQGGLDNDWYWDRELVNDWPVPTGQHYNVTVDGIPYVVYVATHKSIVKPGETTAPSLMGVYLDKGVDYDNEKKTYVDQNGNEFTFPNPIQVLVKTEACQATGFANAQAALEEAFGVLSDTNNPFTGYSK